MVTTAVRLSEVTIPGEMTTSGAIPPGRRFAIFVVHVLSFVPPEAKSVSMFAAVVIHMSPIIPFARLAASARYRASFVTRSEVPSSPTRPSTPNAKIRIAISASSR